MRPKLLVPLALLAVVFAPTPGWAPPPFRPAPPPPPPPRPTPPRPVTPVRPPTTTPYRPAPTYRPPLLFPAPGFQAQLEEARRRNAAEAAELLRRQSAASLSRAQRAALLNALAHDLLRQQQAASLAELRRLRADWVAVGPGAGLDPVIALQLDAAESAAERVLLAEVLQLVADSQFALAETKLGALESPRHLPAAVAQELPEVRAALAQLVPFAQVQSNLLKKNAGYESALPGRGNTPPAVADALLAWEPLAAVQRLFARGPAPTTDEIANALQRVDRVHGGLLTSKLRVELAARVFLDGSPADAKALLDGAVDMDFAAEVLADLQAAVLGRGDIKTPQVAAFVPADRATPPARSAAILSPDQLAKWKPPARTPGETTVEVAIAAARKNVKAAVDVEVSAGTTKVNAAADKIRAALATEAAPLKVFLEKVGAARGKPLAGADERLAAGAGARGLTVAEAVGLLAVEADRPACAARLLAAAPAFGDFGSFAAGVEVAGRAPAGFAALPDAGFKLAPVPDRARIRAAVAGALNAQAGAAAAGQPEPDLDRAALEADLHTRLGLAAGTLAPAECVQGLLDVCRDWCDAQALLAQAMRDLNDAVADIGAGEYGPDDDELKELTTAIKVRRLSVQADKKRREAGLVIGCQLLGGYGASAAPAREWLRAQTGADGPWRTDAAAALEKTGAK